MGGYECPYCGATADAEASCARCDRPMASVAALARVRALPVVARHREWAFEAWRFNWGTALFYAGLLAATLLAGSLLLLAGARWIPARFLAFLFGIPGGLLGSVLGERIARRRDRRLWRAERRRALGAGGTAATAAGDEGRAEVVRVRGVVRALETVVHERQPCAAYLSYTLGNETRFSASGACGTFELLDDASVVAVVLAAPCEILAARLDERAMARLYDGARVEVRGRGRWVASEEGGDYRTSGRRLEIHGDEDAPVVIVPLDEGESGDGEAR